MKRYCLDRYSGPSAMMSEHPQGAWVPWEEYQTMVNNLPQTADGVPVVPGMDVWLDSPSVHCCMVTRIMFGGAVHLDFHGAPHSVIRGAQCYSTREAAEKEYIMGKYRKKPLVVEAFQMTKARRWDNSEWPNWLNQAWQKGPGEGGVWIDPAADIASGHNSAEELVCGTLEGVLRIDWNDWIIQGVKRELYPCKPDIFEATYEAVEE